MTDKTEGTYFKTITDESEDGSANKAKFFVSKTFKV